MLAEAALLVALTVERGSGAESCLDESRLARAVERRLKRKVFVDAARADLRFAVKFSKRDSEIEVSIAVAGKDGASRGSRSLTTEGHCSTLDDSLALSIALLVDQPPEPEEPAQSVDSAAPAAQPAPRAHSISIPPDVSAPREPWHVQLGAAAVATWGSLPGVSPAVSLSVRLLPPRLWPVLLSGDTFLPASVERDADAGARFRLLRFGLALCPTLLERGRVQLGSCVGQKVGWLRVDGYGFDHDAREQRLSYTFTLGGEARLRLVAPVSLRAYLGAEVPVVRDRFASAGRSATELFQPAPVGVAGEIGIEAALW